MLITHSCCTCCWAVFTWSQGLSASHTALPARRLAMQKKLGRGHSRDNWPKLAKGIFHTVWHYAEHLNCGGVGQQVAAAAWGLAGHRSAGGEQLHCVSLVYSIIVSIPSFPVLLNCLYLNARVLPFFQFSPRSLWGRSERTAVWCLAACWVKQQHSLRIV